MKPGLKNPGFFIFKADPRARVRGQDSKGMNFLPRL